MAIIPTDELFFRTSDSESSSDSEREGKLPSYTQNQYKGLSRSEKKELDQIIAEINKKRKNGEEIDFTAYPPLFVAHWRGSHYFTQFFDQDQRQEIRARITRGDLQEGIYSPAVYEHAGLELGQPIDTPKRKKAVKLAIRELNEAFSELACTTPSEPNWWGKKKESESLLFQHYQRYVNTYEQFRRESVRGEYECFEVLPAEANPYVSTADSPRHAVLYALGAKAEVKHGCLRPGYSESLRPKHPKVGHVYTIFHTLQSIARNDPLPLSTLQASCKVEINDRVLNERETTFKVAVSKDHVVDTHIVRVPTMKRSYKAGFHDAKYGFTDEKQYNTFKKSLENKAPSSTFIQRIADHYSEELADRAVAMARERGGFLVALALDGTLRQCIPTTMDISNAKKSKHPDRVYDAYQDSLECYKDDESDSFDELIDRVSKMALNKTTHRISKDEMRGIIKSCKAESGFKKVKAQFKKGELSVDSIANDTRENSLLNWAIYKQQSNLVDLLLELDVDLSYRNKDKETAAHYVAMFGSSIVLKKIIDKLPKLLHARDQEGDSLLHWAVYENKIESVRCLGSYPDLDVNTLNKKGKTAYEIAVKAGNKEIVKILRAAK
jgi:hypothetical protein